jgi:cation-transporting ATPase 13A1
VQVGEKVCGDPIETESVKALGWSYNARTSTCTPGDKPAAPCIDKGSSCKILFRYHFSSKLQRMATITRVAGKGGGGTWLLVKGSPEAVGRLLAKQPAAYATTYRAMAENGMRVLALAYRPLEGDEVRPLVSGSHRVRSHAPPPVVFPHTHM